MPNNSLFETTSFLKFSLLCNSPEAPKTKHANDGDNSLEVERTQQPFALLKFFSKFFQRI